MLDKRAGLNFATDDVFVNVAGGMALWTSRRPTWRHVVAAVAAEPAQSPDSVRHGGLRRGRARRRGAGGLAVGAARVREAAQLGFTRCVVPDGNVTAADVPEGMAIVGVRTVGEALDALM